MDPRFAAGSSQRFPARSTTHPARRPPRIRIVPDPASVSGGGSTARFRVLLNDHLLRSCDSESIAHHWAMHVFELVNRGLRDPARIRAELSSLCLSQQLARRHAPTRATRWGASDTHPLPLRPNGGHAQSPAGAARTRPEHPSD